jgi:hypothetical membrane protein
MADIAAAGRVAVAGVAVFIVAVLALHLLQPGLDPRKEAVSYYVHGPFGWLLTIGLIALGIGSLCLVFALAQTLDGRWSGTGRWLVGVWGVGVLLGGVFRADPPGRWSEPASLPGLIHGNAAMVAFLALPLAAFCLATAFRQDEQWRREAPVLWGLAVAAGTSLVVFMASLAPVFVRPGPPILLGLSERVLLAVYAGWLATVGIGIARCGRRSGREARDPPKG